MGRISACDSWKSSSCWKSSIQKWAIPKSCFTSPDGKGMSVCNSGCTLDCRETTSTKHQELRELIRISKNWRKECFFVFSMYLQSPLVQISATPHSRTSIAVWWRTSASCLARLRECPMPTVARRPTPPLPSQAPAPAPAPETTRATVRLWWPFVLNFFFFPFVLCNPKP